MQSLASLMSVNTTGESGDIARIDEFEEDEGMIFSLSFYHSMEFNTDLNELIQSIRLTV